MIANVLISLPIFGVVALGWPAMRIRLATRDALDAVGAFAFRFALPALTGDGIEKRQSYCPGRSKTPQSLAA